MGHSLELLPNAYRYGTLPRNAHSGTPGKVRPPDNAGFTLVELVLTMVIIGALAVIVLPKILGKSEDAKVATTKANLEALRSAVGMYMAKNSRPPNDLEDVVPEYIRAIPKEAITPSNAVKLRPWWLPDWLPLLPDGRGGWLYYVWSGRPRVRLNLFGQDAHGNSYWAY